MIPSKHPILLTLLLFPFLAQAQNYPGGVTGAEVWYIADWHDIDQDVFRNFAQTDITISKCGEHSEHTLFNFNPSILAEELCLAYPAPLENSTGRNVFFVGEPNKDEVPFSHLATDWKSDFGGLVQMDSIMRNFFDLNDKNLYAPDIYEGYPSDKNAHVNFYHTNNYNINKKFKSYGQEGETVFLIGHAPTNIDPEVSYNDKPFFGNFPEFISFDRELSANERNRVESYLALKYGLTLNKNNSYLSSRNIIFWDASNNNLFPNRIFGFGRDGISGLNQLQSESTHLKGHLVGAIEDIVETNIEKQSQVHIPNDHYLVFGDNDGKPDFVTENSHGVRIWEKVWLAQRTGEGVQEFPIYFKLYLEDQPQLLEYLHDHPEENLWLLHDLYIGNDEVSDFDSENIEYYPGEINWEEKTAYFRNVHFDKDQSVYDQFTFGVGPQMIVQAQVHGCKKDELELVLDITGGRPEYIIEVQYNQSGFEDHTGNTTYSFPVQEGVTYHIIVHDSNGLVADVEITVEPWSFDLNLGPDQFLTPSQPEITLDAGQGIDDPDAIYQWYHDGVLLPDTGSTLTVDEIGEYEMVVTSGDLSCSVSDTIRIDRIEFEVHISIVEACDEFHNTVFIDIDGGTAPFTTTLESTNSSTNYAHNNSTSISDLSYGNYTITVTDSTGEVFTDSITISEPPANLGMDLYTQLEDLIDFYGNNSFSDYSNPDIPLFYINNSSTFSLDASLGVTIPNISYEWYMNGQPLGINGPVLTLVAGYDCYTGIPIPIYTVVATDSISNCSASQSFTIRGRCPDDHGTEPLAKESDGQLELDTKVYPNPSQPNATFTYEVFATEQFDGTVEVFTVTGAKLYSIEVHGGSSYTLPFNLQASGMYLIRTVTSLGIVKTDRVIISN